MSNVLQNKLGNEETTQAGNRERASMAPQQQQTNEIWSERAGDLQRKGERETARRRYETARLELARQLPKK